MRHFFVSVCIENDVPISTISAWIGHSDGGALAMRTYGHLRKEHSRLMAKKVKFLPVVEPEVIETRLLPAPTTGN